MQEKQHLTANFERELLKAQIEIGEQTLKYISQEVHDNLGQVMSLVKMNINTMNPDKPEELQEKIADSKQLVSQVIQDLRNLSKSLNTDYISKTGLEASIKNELQQVQKNSSYTITCTVKGSSYHLEPQKELILFRIFQEALHNIIKHADTRCIAVSLSYNPNFELRISDNGKGFDPAAIGQPGKPAGLGIVNMKNRATMIGASLNIQSQAAQGTTVAITLPA